MPIKNLTDTPAENVQQPFVVVFRKGGEMRDHKTKQGVKIMGQDLDHFRPTPADNAPDPAKLLADIEELYGETPGDKDHPIPVYLSSATRDVAWMAFNEEWKGGKLVDAYAPDEDGTYPHRCDGEYLWRFDKGANGYVITNVACPYSLTTNESPRERVVDKYGKAGGCKPVGRLTLILPDLFERGHLGVARFLTNSVWDIANISHMLSATEQMFGMTYGVPMWIRRVEKEIAYTEGGVKKRVRKNLIDMYVDPTWQAEQFKKRFESRKMLPAPTTLHLESGDVVEGQVVQVETGQYVDENTGEVVDERGASAETGIPNAAYVQEAPAPEVTKPAKKEVTLEDAVTKLNLMVSKAAGLGIIVDKTAPIKTVSDAKKVYATVSIFIIEEVDKLAAEVKPIDEPPANKDGMKWLEWIQKAMNDATEVPL